MIPYANPWMFNQPKDHTKLRLFCFPYAGGGATAYLQWQKDILPEVDICPIELPGRGKRFIEQPFTSLAPLIEALAEGIEPYLTMPFVFFGNSTGGLFSFELARYLRQQQM